MPLINPIQPCFSSGEFSPSLFPRVDIEKYRTGLKTCRNFYIHPHGGASNRPGTKHMAAAKHADKMCVVNSFIFSETQAYMLEMGEHYIRFYTDQAQIVADAGQDEWATGNAYVVNDYVTVLTSTYLCINPDGSTGEPPAAHPDSWTNQTIYEIYSPYLEADLRKLRLESSADVIYITHPDYQTRTLSRYGNADWRLELYEPVDGPFMAENVDEDITLLASAVSGSVSLNASTALFDEEHEGALWKLRHYIEGQTDTQAFVGTGTGTGIKCFTTWRLITHGTWTGKLKIEKSTDGGVTWTTLRTFTSVDDFNVNTSGTEDIETNPLPFQVRLNMYVHSAGTCNADLTSDAFYQEGIMQVDTYYSATSLTCTVIQELGATVKTYSWAEGSWSNYRGWPSVSRFFQDRLCFAATPSEPMTIWMTQIGNYTSFLRHSPLLDTDGITTRLPSRQLNAINGLIALRKLIALTSSSEWTIGLDTGAVSSLEQSVQGYRGSYGVNPTLVGNEAIYIQSNGKVVRNFGYEFGSDSFTGAELNILSKHLFDKWYIVELAYQQDPDSIVWALRDDGVLLGSTYMREQEVVAWFWLDTGTVAGNDIAEIESIAAIPGEGYDELWLAVKRGDKRFIEVMSKRIVEAECLTGGRIFLPENSYFVDCGVSYGDNPMYITSITLVDPIMVTAENHGFVNGDIIRLDNIVDYATLNASSWTIGNATANTFHLLTEINS